MYIAAYHHVDFKQNHTAFMNCHTQQLIFSFSDAGVCRFVNQSAHMIHENFSLGRAYALFTSVGLRHLVVVDESNTVRGIITRKDLAPDKLDTARAYVDRTL
jgi:predicted transcriptional regulator